jgi:hypothetical protein
VPGRNLLALYSNVAGFIAGFILIKRKPPLLVGVLNAPQKWRSISRHPDPNRDFFRLIDLVIDFSFIRVIIRMAGGG